MGASSVVIKALSSIVILFSLFWSSTRVVAYFFWTFEQNVADFNATVVPAGSAPEVLAEFSRRAIAPLFNERQTLIRLHVASGALLVFLVTFQVIPQLRHRYFGLHRIVGKAMFFLWLITVAYGSYILFVMGMVNIGPGALHLDDFSLLLFVVGGLLGFGGINQNNVARHRTGMILLTLGAFTNPLQRLLWAIVSQLKVGGPYTSYAVWEYWTTSLSAYLTCVLLALFAVYQIFFVLPSPKDLARRGGKSKSKSH